MKCPRCGNELKQSKKDPTYMLCFECKKKFKLKEKAEEKSEEPAETTPETSEEAGTKDQSTDDATRIFSRKKEGKSLSDRIGARRRIKDGTAGTAPEKKPKKKRPAPEAQEVPETDPAEPAEAQGTISDVKAEAPAASQEETGEYRFRYANIPPKEVREKQEQEMRKAYDELLAIGEEERKHKRRGLFGRRK